MIIQEYKGFVLRRPTSGGKAGKGYNVSSSIQVMKVSGMRRMMKWQTRYLVHDMKSKQRAIARCKAWINRTIQEEVDGNTQGKTNKS